MGARSFLLSLCSFFPSFPFLLSSFLVLLSYSFLVLLFFLLLPLSSFLVLLSSFLLSSFFFPLSSFFFPSFFFFPLLLSSSFPQVDPYQAKLMSMQKAMGTSFRGPKELAEKQAALQAKLAEKQKAEGAVGQTTNAASAASLSKPAEKSATAPVKAEATELHASILYDFDRLRTKPWPEEVVPEQLERHL